MKNSQIPASNPRHQRASESGFFNPRVLLAFAVCSFGVCLAMLRFAAPLPSQTSGSPGDPFSAATTPDVPSGPGWPIITSPNNDLLTGVSLGGVTCVSASDCWAVGDYGSTSADQ